MNGRDTPPAARTRRNWSGACHAMDKGLRFQMEPQPDDSACGPTCLHAIYRHYGDPISLAQVLRETERLYHGGTLASLLGAHALRRGYRATIHTYNLQVWDPTWFGSNGRGGYRVRDTEAVCRKLTQQLRRKGGRRLRADTTGYVEFLKRGGEVHMEDPTPALIRRYLSRRAPILAGLSATFLYRGARERGPGPIEDDVRGGPAGHFVVLTGYSPRRRKVLVADPLHPNPPYDSREYPVGVDRLVGAILLGILTYDATMLVIEPAGSGKGEARARGARSRE